MWYWRCGWSASVCEMRQCNSFLRGEHRRASSTSVTVSSSPAPALGIAEVAVLELRRDRPRGRRRARRPAACRSPGSLRSGWDRSQQVVGIAEREERPARSRPSPLCAGGGLDLLDVTEVAAPGSSADGAELRVGQQGNACSPPWPRVDERPVVSSTFALSTSKFGLPDQNSVISPG